MIAGDAKAFSRTRPVAGMRRHNVGFYPFSLTVALGLKTSSAAAPVAPVAWSAGEHWQSFRVPQRLASWLAPTTAVGQLDWTHDHLLLAGGCPLNVGDRQKRVFNLMFSGLMVVRRSRTADRIAQLNYGTVNLLVVCSAALATGADHFLSFIARSVGSAVEGSGRLLGIPLGIRHRQLCKNSLEKYKVGRSSRFRPWPPFPISPPRWFRECSSRP